MDRFTEIPIIGGLFEAIAVYLRLTGAIIRRPFAFARQTDFADPREPRQALRYLLASVVVSYLILVPAFARHQTDVSQAMFLIFQVGKIILITLSVHPFLRWFGSKRPLRTTVAITSYANGFWIPIVLLINIPYLMAVGRAVLFGGFRAALAPELAQKARIALTPPIVQVMDVLAFVWWILGLLIVVAWYAHAHGLRKPRTAAATLLGVATGYSALELVFFPAWELVKDVLSNILRFV